MTFPERLRYLRKTKGETQRQAASSMRMTPQALSQYEKGIRTPTATSVILFSKYYGCSADYLLGLSDVRTPPVEEYSDSPISKYIVTTRYKGMHCITVGLENKLGIDLEASIKSLEKMRQNTDSLDIVALTEQCHNVQRILLSALLG